MSTSVAFAMTGGPLPTNPVKPAIRFAFIDGLRGLAALGIAGYHIWRYEPAPYPSEDLVPEVIEEILLRSWIGVQFLLVISGFVIAYTLRDTWITPREALSFLGRRIVRLVPPYWFTIFLVVLVSAVGASWWGLPSPFEDSLTVGRVLAHMGFMQDVLGHTPLSAGIWTVCIEMQFYVVYVLAWGLAQRFLARRDVTPPRPSAWGALLIFAPWALASLVYWNRLDSTEPWVTHFLNAFFLGIVTWWVLDRTIPTMAYVSVMCVVAVHLVVAWKVENALALTAALSIFVAARTDHLHDWLNWRWLQFLGRTSYSLYLIHYPVSHLLVSLCWKWNGNAPSPMVASLSLLGCLAVSLLAGQLLFATLERPAARWSNWLKLRAPREPRVFA